MGVGWCYVSIECASQAPTPPSQAPTLVVPGGKERAELPLKQLVLGHPAVPMRALPLGKAPKVSAAKGNRKEAQKCPQFETNP